MIVEEVQVYLLVDLHFDCYVNNNLKFQKLHLIATWGGGGGGGGGGVLGDKMSTTSDIDSEVVRRV